MHAQKLQDFTFGGQRSIGLSINNIFLKIIVHKFGVLSSIWCMYVSIVLVLLFPLIFHMLFFCPDLHSQSHFGHPTFLLLCMLMNSVCFPVGLSYHEVLHEPSQE